MQLLINIRDAKEINKVPHIRELIVLCHIVNSNHSIRDQYLRMDHSSLEPASMRDNIYGMLLLSSITYEGMLKGNSILKNLAGIVPENLYSEIAWLHSEIKSSNSFFNKVLKPIRNELGFHFTHSLANLPLHKSIPRIPPVLAEVSEGEESEMIYVLPTDIMSSYFLSLVSEPIDPKERLTSMITQLGEYNRRISNLFREIVYAIISELQPILLSK
jgi:hypothetical protein